mgnify:CR=1 FL=1
MTPSVGEQSASIAQIVRMQQSRGKDVWKLALVHRERQWREGTA